MNKNVRKLILVPQTSYGSSIGGSGLPSFDDGGDTPDARRRRFWFWVVFAILSILLHLVLFVLPWERLFPTSPPQIAPVEIKPVNPEVLEKIRREWSKKEKSLLLNKDQSPVTPSEKPKDAKYMSDRNRIVEKEQRARETNVIPQPGTQVTQSQEEAPAKPKQRQAETRVKQPLPDLSQLGVPLNKPKYQPRPEPEEPLTDPSKRGQALRPRSQPGGDQALLDKSLPQGSENLLNTEQSVYYSFYSRLYEAIGPVWQSRIREVAQMRRIPPGSYLTQVDVVFNGKGELVDIRYITSSGIREFDQAVDTSWHRIERFPNPPRDLLDANGEIHTGWTFNVDINENFGVFSGPPARDY